MFQAEISPKTVAVIGASQDRSKFGNKCVRAYSHAGWTVYPVNPNATEVEGIPCARSLRDLPAKVRGVSVITPPDVTERIV